MLLKTRAVSNWAKLTVGLLNQEYYQLEQAAQLQQQRHLHQRQLYLDEQLQLDAEVCGTQYQRSQVKPYTLDTFLTQPAATRSAHQMTAPVHSLSGTGTTTQPVRVSTLYSVVVPVVVVVVVVIVVVVVGF